MVAIVNDLLGCVITCLASLVVQLNQGVQHHRMGGMPWRSDCSLTLAAATAAFYSTRLEEFHPHTHVEVTRSHIQYMFRAKCSA